MSAIGDYSASKTPVFFGPDQIPNYLALPNVGEFNAVIACVKKKVSRTAHENLPYEPQASSVELIRKVRASIFIMSRKRYVLHHKIDCNQSVKRSNCGMHRKLEKCYTTQLSKQEKKTRLKMKKKRKDFVLHDELCNDEENSIFFRLSRHMIEHVLLQRVVHASGKCLWWWYGIAIAYIKVHRLHLLEHQFRNL